MRLLLKWTDRRSAVLYSSLRRNGFRLPQAGVTHITDRLLG